MIVITFLVNRMYFVSMNDYNLVLPGNGYIG